MQRFFVLMSVGALLTFPLFFLPYFNKALIWAIVLLGGLYIIFSLWLLEIHRFWVTSCSRVNWRVWWGGSCVTYAGGWIIALALLYADDRTFKASRWLVLLFGVSILLIGLMMINYGMNRQNRGMTLLLSALLLTCLGIIFSTVALVPGQGKPTISLSLSLPFFDTSITSKSEQGRLFFLPCAGLLNVMALMGWGQFGQWLFKKFINRQISNDR